MVLVVTHILAKDKLRVRFPLPAPSTTRPCPVLFVKSQQGSSTSAFGEMDIIPGFEPGGGSSILSGPANSLWFNG